MGDRHECWYIVVDSYPYLVVRSFIHSLIWLDMVSPPFLLAMHHIVFAAEHCPKKYFRNAWILVVNNLVSADIFNGKPHHFSGIYIYYIICIRWMVAKSCTS